MRLVPTCRTLVPLLVLLACSMTSIAPHAAAASRVADVLDANRRAAGAFTRGATIELEYAFTGQDMTGTTWSTFDRRTGAYVDRYVIGPSKGANGFDGRLAWMQDISGAYTPQDGGDRRAVAVNEAYRNADRWWRPDRGGAHIAYVGRETIDGISADRLRVAPPGGKPFDAWFDAATRQLVRVEEEQQFLRVISRFGDYAPEHGMMVAHSIVVDSGTGEAGMQTLRLARASVGPARALSVYAMPPWRPDDAWIENGAAQTVVPIRLANNHVYVEARVNGEGPFVFIVDTGGHTILAPSALAKLKLRSEGSAPSAGAGEEVTTNGYAQVREIAVGGMRLRDQTAFTLAFMSKETEGFEVDGMIGFEVFRRFVVRIDYGAGTMTIIDPARFDARGAGTAIPFRFYDHNPQVEGRVGAMPARLNIDTGSRSEVDLTTPFVARARLREAYAGGVSALTGWGVGGAVRSEVVRLPSLGLGSVQVDRPVGSLSATRGGSFSDANYEGNVGTGLLKRFVVTFDYAHQRMYLARRDPAPADAGTFDRSGLWINLGADGFVVVDVAAGSPAERAGVAVGDVVTAIDGRTTGSLGLSDARERLRVPPAGTRVRLDLARDGAARSVEITLADQIPSD